MQILTEINVDCSFMQTIIKLPQERVDLISAGIDKNIVDRLENYLVFAKDIQALFQSNVHLKDFIESSVENKRVYYVKTFSADILDLTENREFICFGDYHRNISGQQTLFFRIDQKWEDFDFPFIQNFQNLKRYISILSGTTIDTIFPSIFLEQRYLNDTSEISKYNLDLTELENLFLFSTDYFGKSYFFNNNGEVFYLKLHSTKIEKSQLDFRHWLDNELANIFKPKSVDQ